MRLRLLAVMAMASIAWAIPVHAATDAEATIIRILDGIYQQGTQPPLAPTGGATEAKQDAGNASLDSIDDKLSGTLNTTNIVSATTVTSTALEASKVIKSSAGSLVSLSVFNSKASAQFILIMNSPTVPADGAVTLLYPPIPIAANSIVMVTFPIPLTASSGIAVSNSSTGTFTKTIGAADCIFSGQVQ